MIPGEVKVNGTGIPNLKAKLIKTDGKVAMFLRNDGQYETGIAKFQKKDHVWPNGSVTKAGTFLYWGNEDFGAIAKTTSSRERAEEHYKQFGGR